MIIPFCSTAHSLYKYAKNGIFPGFFSCCYSAFCCFFCRLKKRLIFWKRREKTFDTANLFSPIALLARLLVVFAELAATASAICSTQVRKGSRIRNTWVRHFYPCGMGSYEISRKKEEGRGFCLPQNLVFLQLGEHGVDNGHHHGSSGCIGYPHGQKHGGNHEAQHQSTRRGPDRQKGL